MSLISLSSAGRSLLVLNGAFLAKTGVEYLFGTSASSQPTLAKLFKNECFNDGGVLMLTPFLACSYLTVAVIDLAAAALFRGKEAGVVLLSTGAVFHLCMSVARLNMGSVRDRYYRPGMVFPASVLQGTIGALSIAGAACLFATE